MFVIHAAGAPEKAHELFSVIRDELDRAADNGFVEAELGRVKAQMKMGLLAALESSSARAEQLARHVLFCGRVLPTAELVERIEAVNTADLRALLQKVLGTPLSLATVGPVAKLGRFEAVADKFVVPVRRAA
jgi:predicted Zn-dependent peptidase